MWQLSRKQNMMYGKWIVADVAHVGTIRMRVHDFFYSDSFRFKKGKIVGKLAAIAAVKIGERIAESSPRARNWKIVALIGKTKPVKAAGQYIADAATDANQQTRWIGTYNQSHGGTLRVRASMQIISLSKNNLGPFRVNFRLETGKKIDVIKLYELCADFHDKVIIGDKHFPVASTHPDMRLAKRYKGVNGLIQENLYLGDPDHVHAISGAELAPVAIAPAAVAPKRTIFVHDPWSEEAEDSLFSDGDEGDVEDVVWEDGEAGDSKEKVERVAAKEASVTSSDTTE